MDKGKASYFTEINDNFEIDKMKGWTKISDLPAWLRVKAKTNIALNKRRGGYSNERKEDRLLYAFRWSSTPEGIDYWSSVDNGNIPEKPNNNNG